MSAHRRASDLRRDVAAAAGAPDAVALIARGGFAAAALVALGSAVAIAIATPVPAAGAGSAAAAWPLWPRDALVAGLLIYAAAAAWMSARSIRPSFPRRASMLVAAASAMALAGACGAGLGNGIREPALGLLGIIVAVVTALVSVEGGAAMALLGIALLTALAAFSGGGAGGIGGGNLLPFLLQSGVVIAGLLGGGLVARVLRHYLEAAHLRTRHAEDMLRLAADYYWEQDREHRFTRISAARADVGAEMLASRLGRRPWEIAGIGHAEADVDAHRADLEARRPFSGLVTRNRDATGRLRVHHISGEPRFDAQGVFTGYWGVARDVTDEVRAQRAFAASETRYRELFERSPSPIFLQRHGVVFDANASAARLFGFANAAAMNGTRLADLHAPGDWRQRALERIAALEAMPVGEGVPVRDVEARTVDGRRIAVQATAVRVDAPGGPATLTIMFDITARRAAEAALRRSEAVLSQLFATSPDSITLSEWKSGRYRMVNAAFTRLTGYSSEETLGHTATELNLWADLADRERMRERFTDSREIGELPVTVRAKGGRLVKVRVSAARVTIDDRAFMVTNARDVTDSERTRLEHGAIFERASIGIALTRDRRFVQVNPRFEAIFGWPAGALAGEPGLVVWVDGDYARIGALAGPLLSQGLPFEIECEMQRRDGSRFWGRMLGQAVDAADPGRGGTIWIADDFTERRRIDAALAAARDAAESASRAKSAFLANTSHEIRTPLNAVLGLARLALAPGLDAATRQRYLEEILASAQGLEGILSDILDFSKIEAGKFTLESVPFDVHALLESARRAYRPLADAKRLALALEIDAGVPRVVSGDPTRVRQIVGNFLSNAVKFTGQGGVRLVATAATGDALRLAVHDSGPGIDAATRALLFEPFSQGDVSKTRLVGGTGLGLSICRQLARLMGGDVGVDSAPGEGAVFWAELPLVAAPAAAMVESDEGDDDGERLRGARVLLVEDNPVNMMIASATLAQWGVVVVEARDGRAGVDAVEDAARRGLPFQLVLMDVQMPVLSGHEAAADLRRRWSAEALPIVALTAAALVSEREQAAAAGMNDFLTKPIDALKLRRTLLRHISPVSRGGDAAAAPPANGHDAPAHQPSREGAPDERS